MKKDVVKFLGLGLAWVVMTSGTVSANEIKYLEGNTKSYGENIRWDTTQSIACKPVGTILVSTGWEAYAWDCPMQTITIDAKNNGSKQVYCEITKSDGTYLGAGRNFILAPGESYAFTRSAGTGEYTLYVYNEDGSKLNVFVSAKQMP